MEEQVAYTKSLGSSAVYVGIITSIERQQLMQGLYQVISNGEFGWVGLYFRRKFLNLASFTDNNDS